ncbi:hypothetical protein [Endozoicomonas sp. GU-1]|uniref:hypothetical protein n=1 Tax=Endozoicomonas sp. GU-1 TaxID=3009078 RepID=UPI0022B52158|nr:hypothetical protein [Endozoicomonas sp. GU-1]WBA79916.1 hypothetical protein O2T12_16300 [Endozoicomonas sp. GU-1]
MICLGSGALLDFAVAAYEGKETGEQALLRKLFSHLQDGGILLGDANFENYFLLALLLQAKADVVFEKMVPAILISGNAIKSWVARMDYSN